MKRILIIAIAALALTGCQEKKNAAAVSQTDVRIDSLQRIIDQKDNELNDVISTFNEIQEGFRLIELAEKNVSIIKDGEATNKPEQIRESIRSIQQRMHRCSIFVLEAISLILPALKSSPFTIWKKTPSHNASLKCAP